MHEGLGFEDFKAWMNRIRAHDERAIERFFTSAHAALIAGRRWRILSHEVEAELGGIASSAEIVVRTATTAHRVRITHRTLDAMKSLATTHAELAEVRAVQSDAVREILRNQTNVTAVGAETVMAGVVVSEAGAGIALLTGAACPPLAAAMIGATVFCFLHHRSHGRTPHERIVEACHGILGPLQRRERRALLAHAG